jgi:hypothetical protein
LIARKSFISQGLLWKSLPGLGLWQFGAFNVRSSFGRKGLSLFSLNSNGLGRGITRRDSGAGLMTFGLARRLVMVLEQQRKRPPVGGGHFGVSGLVEGSRNILTLYYQNTKRRQK